MNFIAEIDVKLFYLLNTKLTSSLLDAVMPFVTLKTNFSYAIVLVAVFALIPGGRKDLRGVGLAVAVVVVSGLTAEFLKDVILRTRPCHALEGVRLLVKCSSTHSLPSGHATYVSAGMVFLSIRYRRYWPFFMAFAFIVAYSRVYVGVHYPFDVLSSAFFGAVFAILFAEADKRFFQPRKLS